MVLIPSSELKAAAEREVEPEPEARASGGWWGATGRLQALVVLVVGAALFIAWLVWALQQPRGEPLTYNPYFDEVTQDEMYPPPGQ